MESYNLTPAEILQILNSTPSTEVEINLVISVHFSSVLTNFKIVEECAERMTDDDVVSLIETIERTLKIKQKKLNAKQQESMSVEFNDDDMNT